MTSTWKAALLVALIGVGATGLMAQEAKPTPPPNKKEVKEKKAEITEAAKKALAKLAGDAKYTTERAGKNWKAEWTVDGKDHEAIVDGEGKLLRTEDDVDAKDVPEAVRKAAAKHFGEDIFVDFVKITKGETVFYEADSKKGEVVFDAAGNVTDDDDDGDDDDDDESEDDD
jgi:hypothetical protein